MRILVLAAAAVLAAGCNGTPENGDGGGEKKDAWPTAGEWRRTNQPPAGTHRRRLRRRRRRSRASPSGSSSSPCW